MAGMFEALLATADGVMDTVYADLFAFTPMREVKNGKPAVDGTRSAIASLEAVFDDQGLMLALAGQMPDRASSSPMISVREIFLPQGVKRFDRFTRLDTEKVYEVRDRKPDGLGRIILTVAEIVA